VHYYALAIIVTPAWITAAHFSAYSVEQRPCCLSRDAIHLDGGEVMVVFIAGVDCELVTQMGTTSEEITKILLTPTGGTEAALRDAEARAAAGACRKRLSRWNWPLPLSSFMRPMVRSAPPSLSQTIEKPIPSAQKPSGTGRPDNPIRSMRKPLAHRPPRTL
jgi:hypothetical protein